MKFYPLKKLTSLLEPSQKKQSILLIIMMCFASILELVGLGFIIVMINFFLGKSDIVQFGIFEPLFLPIFNNFDFSSSFHFVLTAFFLFLRLNYLS